MQETDLSELVTFSPNKFEPIHNWFYYKEGYSRKLVDKCIGDYSMEGPIYDPFCGVGTTLLSCRQRGIESIGTDVSPLAALASRAKTHNYDLNVLNETMDYLRSNVPEPKEQVPKHKWLKRLFPFGRLAEILAHKRQVLSIPDEKARP